MPQEIAEPDRIRELEDALKEAERHIYLSSSGCTILCELDHVNRGEYRFSAVSSFQTDRKHPTDALRKAGCRNNSRIFCICTELVGFWTRSGPKGRALHMSVPGPHHQCAFSTPSTDVAPAIIEPVIATSAGTLRGNSRLISEAMKIAAMGRAMTK
jgi:hypothetical protein